MKRKVCLVAAVALLAGCVYNSKVSTSAEQLQHHRFVLESVDGKALTNVKTPLELRKRPSSINCTFPAICVTSSTARDACLTVVS